MPSRTSRSPPPCPHQSRGEHANAHVRLRSARAECEALLKPGTFARVRLETSLVEQVMTIPYAAMHRYGVYRAFAVAAIDPRELKTGDRVGDRMEILAGLNTADRVAMTDVDTLTDGMKIAVEGEE